MGRAGKVELRTPNVDAANLRKYIQQQVREAATVETATASKQGGLLENAPPPPRRSLTEANSKACSIF